MFDVVQRLYDKVVAS